MGNFRHAKYDPTLTQIDDPSAVTPPPLAPVPQFLPRFTAAIRRTLVNTADTKIALLGDSTFAGAFSNGTTWGNARANSVPSKLTAMLKTDTLAVTGASVFGTALTLPNAYDPRIAVSTANWSDLAPSWLGGGAFRNNTNEASTLSFTPLEEFDTVTVYYLLSAGGASFDIAVNGGATLGNTVNTNATINLASTTRTAPRGIGTVNIRRLIGTGACPILGIDCFLSTKRQVRVWNWGAGGATAGYWRNNSDAYFPFPSIATLAPDLTIINLGINDALTGSLPADFLTNMQAIITQCQLSGDVILCTPSPVATASASTAVQFALYSNLRSLAQNNGVPLIDIYNLYGNYISGAALSYFAPANDSIHPGNSGYGAIANYIRDTLKNHSNYLIK